MAVANIDSLFKKAEIEYTHRDKNNDTNFKMIHRLFSPFIYDGEVYIAKLTIKELVSKKEDNPLYSVEALEIKKASRVWNATAISKETSNILTSFPQEALGCIVTSLLNDVNNCSKVIDENGEQTHS